MVTTLSMERAESVAERVTRRQSAEPEAKEASTAKAKMAKMEKARREAMVIIKDININMEIKAKEEKELAKEETKAEAKELLPSFRVTAAGALAGATRRLTAGQEEWHRWNQRVRAQLPNLSLKQALEDSTCA